MGMDLTIVRELRNLPGCQKHDDCLNCPSLKYLQAFLLSVHTHLILIFSDLVFIDNNGHIVLGRITCTIDNCTVHIRIVLMC